MFRLRKCPRRLAGCGTLVVSLVVLAGCSRSTPGPVAQDKPTPEPKQTTPFPTIPDLPKTPADLPKQVEPPRNAYARLIQVGEAALRGQRFDDAVQAYQDALSLVPGDAVASRGLRQAEQALAELRTEYDKAMKDGAQALTQKKFADAVRDFEAALKAKPNDPAARKSLQQAKAGLKDTAGRDDDYDKAMKDGARAVTQRKYADAVKDFEAALKAKPNDPAALKSLEQAKAALQDTAEYEKQMKAGQAAMRSKKFADAVKAFEAALKAMPGDKEAQAALSKAKAAAK